MENLKKEKIDADEIKIENNYGEIKDDFKEMVILLKKFDCIQ